MSLGLCPQEEFEEKYQTGWRVLGIAFDQTPAATRCRVIPAKISPEAACRAWLAALVAAGDPQQTKPAYQQEAQARFGVSREAFRHLWAEATRGHPAWSAPGRRKNKSGGNRPVYLAAINRPKSVTVGVWADQSGA